MVCLIMSGPKGEVRFEYAPDRRSSMEPFLTMGNLQQSPLCAGDTVTQPLMGMGRHRYPPHMPDCGHHCRHATVQLRSSESSGIDGSRRGDQQG